MKIDVLGYEYEVGRGYIPGDATGIVDHKTGCIIIDDNLSPTMSAETVLHEVIHAIEYASRLEFEETEIWLLARGLYSVLKSNAQLLEMIGVCNEPSEDI